MKKFIQAMMATAVIAMIGFASQAMAVELVVVSWGGAYTASQQKAYHDPYMKLNPNIKIVNMGFGRCSCIRHNDTL